MTTVTTILLNLACNMLQPMIRWSFFSNDSAKQCSGCWLLLPLCVESKCLQLADELIDLDDLLELLG
jgi:hypothetical protein